MSLRYRVYSIAILSLLFIVCSSFPFALFIKDATLLFCLQNGLRIIFLIFAYFYIKKETLHKPTFNKLDKSSFLFLPFIICCFSNLFVVLINQDKIIYINPFNLTYALISTVFVSACEEVVFRAVMLMEFSDHQTPFKAILFTSLIFGACHLLNISSVSTILPCLLQAIYTSLIGFVLGFIYLKTKNIILPFIFHMLFNMLNNDLINNMFSITWNFWFYFINIAVGVILVIYWFILFKSDLFKKPLSNISKKTTSK